MKKNLNDCIEAFFIKVEHFDDQPEDLEALKLICDSRVGGLEQAGIRTFILRANLSFKMQVMKKWGETNY